MDRLTWLHERRSGIGASELAAIAGLSSYSSPYEVYLDKINELPVREPSPAAAWGVRLEGVLAAAYAEETGLHVWQPAPLLFRHPSYPWLLATPDRFAAPRVRNTDGLALVDGDTPERVVELKTSWSADGWGLPGTDEVPPAYLLQVQQQLLVTSLRFADVAALLGGSDFRIYRIERSERIHQLIIETCREFWQRVEARNPPPPDWKARRTWELIDLVNRPVEGEAVELPSGCAAWADQYQQLGERIRTLEDERSEARARLVDEMGSAAVGRLADGREIVRHERQRREYTVPAGTYRDFRIKQPKRLGATHEREE